MRRRTWLAHTWRAPKTEQVARYDVPVSPGGMTALSGDLYGSTENTRKAPVADWERNIASGKADPKNAPELRARETHALKTATGAPPTPQLTAAAQDAYGMKRTSRRPAW